MSSHGATPTQRDTDADVAYTGAWFDEGKQYAFLSFICFSLGAEAYAYPSCFYCRPKHKEMQKIRSEFRNLKHVSAMQRPRPQGWNQYWICWSS